MYSVVLSLWGNLSPLLGHVPTSFVHLKTKIFVHLL